ncbi:HK97 family phage prohead protease [Kineobactrum sediminis]|uniref:HK97 family phage prohead protease n=1 Tax=Kineobactrum sediminis TaxID=1905677 RepID=A0A2N5Y2S1_9GAMM|nr:HK97 family phage prohead protease [Kineobactrum sediminis]PLW82659.1 HK97 family phage prohead protease [Kineobactrum sediminis]
MRIITAQVQKFAAGEAGQFSGLAATYGGDPDRHGDTIAPGAFTASLARHDAEGTRPAMLWQHDHTAPVGAWLKFTDSAEGLAADGKLTLDVPVAKSAHALMKDQVLALSIGANIPAGGRQSGDTGDVLTEIDLIEVSLVAVPANTRARITSVKSFDPTNPREFERSVRDALGLSVRETKRLLAGGWTGLVREEQSDDSAELAAIAAKLTAINASLRR